MKLAMRVSVVLCGLLVALSAPLSANLIVTTGGKDCDYSPGINAGLCTDNPNATTITFDSLLGQTLPYTFGPVTYSVPAGGGSGSPFVTGSQSGHYAAPPDDETTYLTVGSPNRPSKVDITFSTPMRYFGLYIGSPDKYNYITFEFYNSGTLTTTVNGGDLFGSANADGSWSRGEYFNFTSAPGTGGFDMIRLYSSQAAFETDNHAFQAVPDGGMTLMLLGGALLGLERLRRRFRN